MMTAFWCLQVKGGPSPGWPPRQWCMGPHQSWSEALMERAIGLGDIIITAGAGGESGADARIPTVANRAAGASTPCRLRGLQVSMLLIARFADRLNLVKDQEHMSIVAARTPREHPCQTGRAQAHVVGRAARTGHAWC